MMGNSVKLIWVLVLVMAVGCSSTKEGTSTNQLEELDGLIDQKSIEFVADWAYPLASNSLNQISNAGLLPPGSSGNRINLIGNANYLRILNDSVSAHLPYYGERQFGGTYGTSDRGIRFNGIPQKIKIEKNKKETAYRIEFKITDNTESYQVFLELFPNKNANLNINSNQRRSISYQGATKEYLAE